MRIINYKLVTGDPGFFLLGLEAPLKYDPNVKTGFYYSNMYTLPLCSIIRVLLGSLTDHIF